MTGDKRPKWANTLITAIVVFGVGLLAFVIDGFAYFLTQGSPPAFLGVIGIAFCIAAPLLALFGAVQYLMSRGEVVRS